VCNSRPTAALPWVGVTPAAGELKENLLGGAGEEALGEVLGEGGGYGSGLGDDECNKINGQSNFLEQP